MREEAFGIVGKLKKKGKSYVSDHISQAADAVPLPGAIPLLPATETFGCWVFPSGPVRLSLANLVTPDSSGVPILMASLVRTPSQREPRTSRGPRPQTLLHNQPPSSRITGAATLPADIMC